MSNKNQETIADIAAKMRGLADRIEKRGLYDLRECGTDYLRALADLIEAAEKQSVTNCNRLGNAARMREALEKADTVFERIFSQDGFIDISYAETREVTEARNEIKAALSAPPRNCDVIDWRTAWAKWRTEIHPQNPCGYAEAYRGTEQFMDWYMSEAKGETK